jgi:hypothetical protein
LSEALLRWPRFADSAAPAAICCFFDFAGIGVMEVKCRRVPPFVKRRPRHRDVKADVPSRLASSFKDSPAAGASSLEVAHWGRIGPGPPAAARLWPGERPGWLSRRLNTHLEGRMP